VCLHPQIALGAIAGDPYLIDFASDRLTSVGLSSFDMPDNSRKVPAIIVAIGADRFFIFRHQNTFAS
jgi:hypothetical protein